jgi:hypothetical protein
VDEIQRKREEKQRADRPTEVRTERLTEEIEEKLAGERAKGDSKQNQEVPEQGCKSQATGQMKDAEPSICQGPLERGGRGDGYISMKDNRRPKRATIQWHI